MPQIVEFNGQTIEFPDGMAAGEIESVLKQHAKGIGSAAPAAVSAGRGINDIPRQIGLTARYGLEGLANAAQVVTEPIRYLTDRVTGLTGKTKPLGALATDFADTLGLPKPQGANERVIGDATRLVAGSGGVSGLAKAGGALLAPLAANMPQQLGSAAGAGLASGASREAGGDDWLQLGAGVLGGVVGGMVPGAASGTGRAVQNFVNDRLPSASAARDIKIDAKLGAILKDQDIDFGALPDKLRQSMRVEMRDAMRTGREVSPDAVRRLLDFQRTGTTPTRGMLTLDPVQITREQNLAKMAANSQDSTLSGLPQLQHQNNATLITRLNDLGAGRGDALRAGESVNSAIFGRQATLRGAEQQAWDAAKSSPGYKQQIGAGVISDINRTLDDEGLMPFMNSTISKYMAAFQDGQPFTPQHYRNLQSMLSREVAKGGNEGAAAGLARRVLERAELMPLETGSTLPATAAQAAGLRSMSAAPRESIDAVNQARAATRAAYAYEDSSPLVKSVLSDGASGDPQRIAQRFVIGGTAQEAETLAGDVGKQGQGVIRDALMTHLKEKALSGASDETGKFSQAAYNKALKQIGERKLKLFFSAEEIDSLKSVGRAASYMQAQPVGSAVNNSNSGALMLGRGFDALKAVAGKVPFGQSMVLDPLRNIDLSLSQRSAMSTRGGLLVPLERRALGVPLLSPGLAAGGLLAAPGVE